MVRFGNVPREGGTVSTGGVVFGKGGLQRERWEGFHFVRDKNTMGRGRRRKILFKHTGGVARVKTGKRGDRLATRYIGSLIKKQTH